MKNVVPCPACNATNKPRAVTCRVCGQRLVASRASPGNREPVVLQRVMTGEVFSAVIVPGADGVRVKERPRSVLDAVKAPPPRGPAPLPPPAGLSDAEVGKLLRDILALAQRGDYAQAVATADRILDDREGDPKALILKADALFRGGKEAEAAAIFDDLIEIDPENPKIWLDRARIQKAMERFPESLESYDRAIAIDGDAADAWYVGDMPGFDVEGARAAGLRPFILDPFQHHLAADYDRVTSLGELAARLVVLQLDDRLRLLVLHVREPIELALALVVEDYGQPAAVRRQARVLDADAGQARLTELAGHVSLLEEQV